MSSSRWIACILVLVTPLPACSDDDPGDNDNRNDDACPEGHLPQGPACIPVFDDCPGLAEIPVPGGGCQAVGATACATGFVSDGEGGCDAILPAEPCGPGTLEVLGETECQPVGVLECAAGFERDGEGGCTALLPAEPCPYATLEVLGETECQPLGDCGEAPWGNVAVDAQTVFADASAEATGADGTSAHPFPTLEAALTAVPAGGQIAIAAGEYDSRLVIDKAVRLSGRCAARVTLRGRYVAGVERPPISIGSGGGGTTIRGVTLTGPAQGLAVNGATSVMVTESQIWDAGGEGIRATRSELVLDRVLIAGSSEYGVFLDGAGATITGSVVRDTRPSAAGELGRGIGAGCDSGGQTCGRLDLSGSLVADSWEVGILIIGAEATITGSVVRDTRPSAAGALGVGVHVQCDADGHGCGRLDLNGTVVAGNTLVGVALLGAPATITGSVVRDTWPDASGGRGRGISAQCNPDGQECGRLDVRSSLVAGNAESGVLLLGVETTILGSVVRDTRPTPSGERGRGLQVQCDPDGKGCGRLEVRGSLVAGNAENGVALVGVPTTVIGSVVRDTRPSISGELCQGILAQCYPGQGCGGLDLTGTLVSGNAVFGVLLSGVATTITGSVVRDTRADASGALGRGIESKCDPAGLGCGRLEVSGTLVMGNSEVGVSLSGVAATITDSAIRDTQSHPGGAMGRGIEAECYPDEQGCGRLDLIGTVVAGNPGVGVLLGGVDASITGSVVRDARPGSGNETGRGIQAQCALDGQGCGRLDVSRTLVARSSEGGVILIGVEATITDSWIRDTRPDGDGEFGRGIQAQCFPGQGCGRLDVSGTLVTGSTVSGVSVFGVPAALSGVAVVDTRQSTEGQWAGDLGQGVYAGCDPISGACATLSVTRCLVRSAFSAGVAVNGVSGFIASSLVDTVRSRSQDDSFGYGIQIGGRAGEALPTFHVRECTIHDASLAGVLYYRAQGTLSRSHVSGGEYCVAMNEGSSPTIDEDNLFACTVRSEPEWVSLLPSPAPPPVTPLQPLEE